MIAASLLAISPAAHAQYGLDTTAGKAGYSPGQSVYSIANTVINFALGSLGIIFLVLMLYAGFRWMTARGNEEHVTKAKDTLTSALLGLIVIVLSYGIVNLVMQNLINK